MENTSLVGRNQDSDSQGIRSLGQPLGLVTVDMLTRRQRM